MVALALQTAALYAPELPDVGGGAEIPGIDKAGHFAIFAFATWAWLRVLPMGWVLVAMAAQMILSEWVQGALLQHRSSEWGDLAADALGVVVGLAVWRWRSGHNSAEHAAGRT